MSKSLTAQLKLTLLDAVTGPARNIKATLAGIKAAAKANGAQINEMRGQLMAAVAAGYALHRALAAPIKTAQDFETIMLDIAQKADLADGAMQGLGRRIRDLAPAMNLTSQQVAKGIDVLMGMGMDSKTAESAIPTLGKVATAYNAEISDLSKTAMAGIDNLKLKIEELPKAMDMLAQAGKSGAFELKDMAQYLPELAAMAESRGMKGLKAVQDLGVAMQIVRKGAGDSAGAAANLKNVLQKMTSEETVKKFKKLAGIDLKKEMLAGKKAGKDPITAIVEATQKAIAKSKGKLGVGDLFTDLQAQLGMAALLSHFEEFKKLQKEVGAANGVWAADYERRMKTSAAQSLALANSLNEVKLAIGNALLPGVNAFAKAMVPVAQAFEKFADANPALVAGIIKLGSALIGLTAAAIGLRLAFAFLKGGALIAAAGAMGVFAGAAKIATAAIAALRGAMLGAMLLGAMGGGGAIAGAFAAIGAAAGASALAIGTVVAAVAAVSAAVYKYWVPIKAFVSGFANEIGVALYPVVEIISNLGTKMGEAFRGLTEKLGISEWVESMKTAIATAWASFSFADLFSQNTYSDEAAASFHSAGARAARALIDAIKNGVSSLASTVIGAMVGLGEAIYAALVGPFQRAASTIAGIGNRIGATIKGIANGAALGGGAGSPGTTPGKRAHGGGVRAGQSYTVGEQGRETFTATQPGVITPNDVLRKGEASASRSISVGAINVTVSGASASGSPEQLGAIIGRKVRAELESAFADGIT